MENKLLSHIKKTSSCLITLLLGATLLLASFSKIANLADFHRTLKLVPFFDQTASGMIVILLPGIELVLGLCFLCRIAIRETAFIATLLFISFTIFNIQVLRTMPAFDCPCFKISALPWLNLSGHALVFRSFLLLVLSVIIMATPKPFQKNERAC